MATRPRRPRDPNQLAKLIVGLSIGEVQEQDPAAGKDPAAIARGRAGGIKGGKSRAKSLSPQQRKQIARKAALSRWKPKQ